MLAWGSAPFGQSDEPVVEGELPRGGDDVLRLPIRSCRRARSEQSPLFDALPLAAASNLLAAREQMAFTLGFHIVLSCFGVAFPAIILIANYLGLKRDDSDAMELARRWSKVMAVTFAVGAVTGTVLTFEFGLLWPRFMERFGSAFGIAFAIEGIFFFTEAIFLAIYLYGWKRLSGWAHFWTGVPIVHHRYRRGLSGRRRQLLDEPAPGLHP